MNTHYDLIGDVHGHADKLHTLLRTLGYRQQEGTYVHPEGRRAIFVGDLIDRGPQQLRTVQIVRRMVAAQSALCVMGNHEFNAIAWHTPAPGGGYLRTRDGKKGEQHRHQHAAFLKEVEHDPVLHAELVAWFKTLPLWLSLPGLRVVHACWHPGAMQVLQAGLKPDNTLSHPLLLQAGQKGTPAYVALETLLKGMELSLPEGISFQDKDGITRHEVRIKWWLPPGQTWRKLALLPVATREQLPDTVPKLDLPDLPSDALLFFGHYWARGTPAPLTPTAACLDYSAGKGGDLVAYRWSGETQLQPQNYVSV